MFSVITKFVNWVFGIEAPEPVPEETKPFSIDHEWPFPSPKPTNEEYLVGELIKGVQVEGDHVFFFWDGQKRRHLRTPQGRETILARNVIWWMEGRKVPATSSGTGLTTNCGEPKCLKLSHLTLKVPTKQYGPENKPKALPVTHSDKAHQPPRPPRIKDGSSTPLEKFTKEDRNKCITRKVYFASEGAASRYARQVRASNLPGSNKRQYPYPCTQGCGGYHLTKINPKKFGKKKVGSW